MPRPKKVVAIGPESTGKSTLCAQLAEHYHTSWVAEYAREYLLRQGTSYNFDDLLTIAEGQIFAEDAAMDKLGQQASGTGSLLVIDTDMYVMEVWCEFVFGNCHRWILEQIARRRYDLYLFCHTDLPWVKDALREYPDLATREKLFHIYKDILVNQQVPWVNIFGNYEERLQKAIQAIDRLLLGV